MDACPYKVCAPPCRRRHGASPPRSMWERTYLGAIQKPMAEHHRFFLLKSEIIRFVCRKASQLPITPNQGVQPKIWTILTCREGRQGGGTCRPAGAIVPLWHPKYPISKRTQQNPEAPNPKKFFFKSFCGAFFKKRPVPPLPPFPCSHAHRRRLPRSPSFPPLLFANPAFVVEENLLGDTGVTAKGVGVKGGVEILFDNTLHPHVDGESVVF